MLVYAAGMVTCRVLWSEAIFQWEVVVRTGGRLVSWVSQWSRKVEEGWNVRAVGSESGTTRASRRGASRLEYDGECGAGEACQSPPMYGVWNGCERVR